MIGIDGDLSWLDDRACQDEDVNSFFPEPNVPLEDRIKEMCQGCPVREQCIRHAYQLPQNAGRFGLMSRANRQQMPLDEALERLEDGTLDDRISATQ